MGFYVLLVLTFLALVILNATLGLGWSIWVLLIPVYLLAVVFIASLGTAVAAMVAAKRHIQQEFEKVLKDEQRQKR